MTARAARLLIVLLAGQALANLDTAIVNVAAPSIRADLHASGAQLQLVVSGYVLVYAVLLITGARLGNLFGYRRMFVLGVGSFSLASLVCGLAPDSVTLIVARCAQGAAGPVCEMRDRSARWRVSRLIRLPGSRGARHDNSATGTRSGS